MKMDASVWGLVASVGLSLIKWWISDATKAQEYQKSWEEWVLWAQNRTTLSAETRKGYASQLEELRAKRAAREAAAKEPKA